eukprot:COSAG01_NODE_45_length_32100_cov_28.037218_19_plen_369_part_00
MAASLPQPAPASHPAGARRSPRSAFCARPPCVAVQPLMAPVQRWGLRPAFLSGLGAIYLTAFFSYYLQFPGLFGVDGVQPVAAHMEHLRSHHGGGTDGRPSWEAMMQMASRVPSLVWLAEPLGVCVDAWLEGLAVAGVVLSLLAIQGDVFHHAGIFGMLWLLYLSLCTVGQSMLSFEWDRLLLETGFMACFYAPLWGSARRHHFPPVAWVLRTELFKVIFMSGIVKGLADCPAWQQLTALEYHFASQCIPTAEAWWVHQLPPFLLRAGAAATLFAQIPGPFLLLAPAASARRLGARPIPVRNGRSGVFLSVERGVLSSVERGGHSTPEIVPLWRVLTRKHRQNENWTAWAGVFVQVPRQLLIMLVCES